VAGLPSTRREYLLLAAILAVRLLASLWFAYHTPLWEKSDEIKKTGMPGEVVFAYIQNLKELGVKFPRDWTAPGK